MINTILFDAELLQKHHPLRVLTLHGLVDDGYNVGIISKYNRKSTTDFLRKADVWLFLDLIVCYPECDHGENPWFTAMSAFTARPDETLCLVETDEALADVETTKAWFQKIKAFDVTAKNINFWIGSCS